MVSFTSFVALGLATLPFSMARPQLEFNREDGRGPCMSSPPDGFLDDIKQVVADELAGISWALTQATQAVKGASGDGKAVTRRASVSLTIKTYVHNVAVSNNTKDGFVSDALIAKQLEVLNTDYAPHKIRFVLAGIDRTINSTWATDTPGTELDMRKQLRKGDYRSLNLYFLKSLRYNAFGYCSFPSKVKSGTNSFFMDGCTIRSDTMPGGALRNFNKGKTTTHEVGHWFGLLHTFEGNSCTGNNDLISDTPAQKSATYGCPKGRDSCTDSAGLDPITNYMDYSFDSCYTNFTPMQRTRMLDLYQLYRANAK